MEGFKRYWCVLYATFLPACVNSQGEGSIAYGRYADQSSDYDDNWGQASKGVDDNTRPEFEYDGCTHTEGGDLKPWWRVRFDKPSVVTSVTLVNRAELPGRLNHFEIRVGYDISADDSIGKNVCHYFDGDFGSSRTFNCPSMPGCFLTIHKFHNPAVQAGLHVCDLTVTGREIESVHTRRTMFSSRSDAPLKKVEKSNTVASTSSTHCALICVTLMQEQCGSCVGYKFHSGIMRCDIYRQADVSTSISDSIMRIIS